MNQKSWDDLNLKTVSTLQTHEITNHKLQKTKLFSLYYICYCVHIFTLRKENKISYISVFKISIYLFTHF